MRSSFYEYFEWPFSLEIMCLQTIFFFENFPSETFGSWVASYFIQFIKNGFISFSKHCELWAAFYSFIKCYDAEKFHLHLIQPIRAMILETIHCLHSGPIFHQSNFLFYETTCFVMIHKNKFNRKRVSMSISHLTISGFFRFTE